jgi:hypothetical protein
MDGSATVFLHFVLLLQISPFSVQGEPVVFFGSVSIVAPNVVQVFLNTHILRVILLFEMELCFRNSVT